MNMIDEQLKTIIDHVGVPIFDFEGKEILISGACGFLGSWYLAVFQMLNKDYFKKPCIVYAVDSGIATDANNHIVKIEDKNIQFRHDDIATMTLDGSVDFIIHAAGIASPVYYRKFPIETIDGMVLGLSNLMKFAVKYPVKSFFAFSSSEMYGNPHLEAVPTPETYYGNVSATGPRSCYDESKRMIETMCVAYHKAHSIPVKWVRPFNIYGPGMRVVDDRVVPKFVFQMLKGEPVTVHLPGAQTRTFCFITDAMIGLFKAMLIGRSGEVYNIGRDKEEITVQALAKKMIRLFPTKSHIEAIEMPTEYPQDQAQRRCPDLLKARMELGYDPKTDLETGLKKTWNWAEKKLQEQRMEEIRKERHAKAN